MKPAYFIVALMVLFTACKKKQPIDNTTPCISGSSDGWKREDLNLNYSIAFPSWYTYGGYIVFEGDYFIKSTYSTDSVNVLSEYGNSGTNTDVWGPVLVNTNVTSVDIIFRDKLITLKNKKRICSNGKTIGYYFYNLNTPIRDTKNTCLGVVYLLRGSDFRQSIIIDFSTGREDEVKGIVSSILPK